MFQIILVSKHMQNFRSIHWQGAENDYGQGSVARGLVRLRNCKWIFEISDFQEFPVFRASARECLLTIYVFASLSRNCIWLQMACRAANPFTGLLEE